MKKSLLFLVVSALLWGGAATAQAEIVSGKFGAEGDNLTWTLDTETKVLKISGTGAMVKDGEFFNAPWSNYRYGIVSVKISNGVTTIGREVFCDYYTDLTSITIPESITSIGDRAFFGCKSLTSVTIPKNVTAIGGNVFSDCSSLREVWFNADSCISGGFGNCYTLTTVHIGVNVKRIPDYAFSACKSLTSVTIPNSVTTIGDRAFLDCTGLTSVTIGKNVQTIGRRAFSCCTSLKSVIAYNPKPVDTVVREWFDSYFAFEDVDYANCTLYVPAESVELYKDAEEWSAFGTILPIDESSAITETQQEQAAERITVYNLQGVLVLEIDDAADLKTLQSGAYIVNGKKMIIVR